MVLRSRQRRVRLDEALESSFSIEVDQVLAGIFKGVSGLNGTMETHEYVEGGVNGWKHVLPGPISYGNVTLETGVLDGKELWEWFYAIASKGPDTDMRRNISIVLRQGSRDATLGNEVFRWNLIGAFPVSWSGPDLSGGSTEVAIQTLELAHYGVFTS